MELVYKQINNIAFSCSSGIGASAMGAAVMNKVAFANNIELTITPVAVNDLNVEYDLVIAHVGFKTIIDRLELKTQVVYIDNYLDKKLFEEIVMGIKDAK